MPIPIDYGFADDVLLQALDLARGDSRLPVEWTSYARSVFDLESKTWTPAFATLLLAKATNDQIDTMSLKAEKEAPNAYSARGLCHRVLVPAAVEHRFSIRNTGREPLNNQPFFRYDRIDEIDRVRNVADRQYFLEVAERANELSGAEARLAFAAFLREALAVTEAAQKVAVKTNELTSRGARIAVEDFLRPDARDRPQRLQAFAAACLDIIFLNVKTRRINDPSRDLPGDVHALAENSVILAMEVRGKPITASELLSFAKACEIAGVHRAIVLVDSPQQKVLQVESIANDAGVQNSQLVVFHSASELLEEVFLWAAIPLPQAIEVFAKGFLARMKEIELTGSTLREWSRAVAIAQGK